MALIGEGVLVPSYAPVPDTLLDGFIEQCHRLLDTRSVVDACHGIVELLSSVLTNRWLIDAIVPQEPGRHTLYEKHGGLTILGHHHPEQIWSRPHDHGRTWAIYGVVTGMTGMHDWECIEWNHDWQPGHSGGKVRLLRSYWIMPGQAFYYPIGAIHSQITYDDTKLIRIEGMNLHRRSLKVGGKSFEPAEGDSPAERH